MSKEPTIEQMNEAIALFEGRTFYGHTIDKFGGNTANALPEMQYHSSWDWLMLVVEKIEKLNWCIRVENWPKCFPTPYKELYSVWMWSNPEDAPEIQTYSDVKIKAVHIAVYQFIQWYNKQKEGNNG